MNAQAINENEGTVLFLPHRLNRQPVVVRGLTADELWLCTGLCAFTGLATGAPMAWLTGSIAMIPTMIVTTIAFGIFIGGRVLRRYKRGRPDIWLYRQLQWHFAQHWPSLQDVFGNEVLITRSGYWCVRRGSR